MSLGDERYVSFTTFRRDGTPVASPVWIVPLDAGTCGFYTSSTSGKAKRLAHTAKVVVQPSDARGRVKPDTLPVEATAEIVRGAEHTTIREKIVAKYGVMVTITKMLATLRHPIKTPPYADIAVKITLPSVESSASARHGGS